MLPEDLPQDFLGSNARFGTDEQCREYLFQARWPDGFRCEGRSHGDAYAPRTRLVYECTACGKQHSLLAGTLFERTKTGLARRFLAVHLVTSSKGGIAAAELRRQPGFGSDQTAWSWLHKLREAMVRPDREPPAGRVEADETHVGGPRPGERGRGAAGKALAAGAVEAGQAGGRRLGRLRLAVVPDASAASLEGFLGAAVATPAAVATDGWGGYPGLPAEGHGHEPVDLGASGGEAALRRPGIHLVFGLAERWLSGTHHGAVSTKHLPADLDEYVFRFNRRTARSIGHGFARLVEQAVRTKPATYRAIVAATASASSSWRGSFQNSVARRPATRNTESG
jgi:ISXO2-like transposase domain/Transposase zinc-ribbon domain